MAMYCVKCRTMREGKNQEPYTMKNGKPAIRAVCEVCGTRINKIVAAK